MAGRWRGDGGKGKEGYREGGLWEHEPLWSSGSTQHIGGAKLSLANASSVSLDTLQHAHKYSVKPPCPPTRTQIHLLPRPPGVYALAGLNPSPTPLFPGPFAVPSWFSSSFTTAGGFALSTPHRKRRCDPRCPQTAPDHCCGASAAVKHAPAQPQAAERLLTICTRRSRCDARNQSRLNMLTQIFTLQCYNTKSNSVTLSCYIAE